MTLTPPRPKCDTLVSLREHLESRLAAQQLAVDSAKELMDVRLTTAEKVLEQRLHGLNQLREGVMSKTEFQSAHSALTAEFHAEAAGLRAEVAGLKEWKAEQRGKASMASVYIAYVVSAILFVIEMAQLIQGMMVKE